MQRWRKNSSIVNPHRFKRAITHRESVIRRRHARFLLGKQRAVDPDEWFIRWHGEISPNIVWNKILCACSGMKVFATLIVSRAVD
jgi:hypothetical protein